MKQQELAQKVVGWIDSYLLSTTKNPINKFKLGFIRPLIPAQIQNICDMASSVGLEIVSPDDGEIDVPRLKECVESGISASGAITVSGMTFTLDDVHSLFSHLIPSTN